MLVSYDIFYGHFRGYLRVFGPSGWVAWRTYTVVRFGAYLGFAYIIATTVSLRDNSNYYVIYMCLTYSNSFVCSSLTC